MITPVMPEVSDSGRYNMTEASKALGIHRNTLRKYAKEGVLKSHTNRRTGRRYFLGYDLKKCWRMMA